MKANLLAAASVIEKVDISAGDHVFSEPTWKGLFLAASINFYAIITCRLFGAEDDVVLHLPSGFIPLQVEAIRIVGSDLEEVDYPANQLWGLIS